MTQYVVVVADSSIGPRGSDDDVRVIGPFADADSASAWAMENPAYLMQIIRVVAP